MMPSEMFSELFSLPFSNLIGAMHTCPCCSETLLRHARHNHIYWFCPHCWQEMPDLESVVLASTQAPCATQHVPALKMIGV
jgi:predicted amidophosphoribosyltransferase